MFRRKSGVVLLVLAMLGTAGAQLPAKGLVIKNTDGLIFIDMGRQDNVMKGDLFDIIDNDVVLHPLSGDTLSVTPRSVGALKVLQVYPKMSLAELLHIQGGKDPMLMQVAQIHSPDRLVEIERYMKQSTATASGRGSQPASTNSCRAASRPSSVASGGATSPLQSAKASRTSSCTNNEALSEVDASLRATLTKAAATS